MTIKTPGKFEGEEDYAPYFYDAMLNGWGDTVEHEGDTLSVFTIDEEDAESFPQLKRRVGEQIAFRESDQGFWEEVEVPAIDETSADADEEPDLSTEAVITDTGRSRNGISLSIEGKHIGDYREVGDALDAYRAYSKKHQISYNIFFVSDHGNYWQIDEHGHELKGVSGGARRAHLYVWQVQFQAAQRHRPGLFNTVTARTQARTEQDAWTQGQAMLERDGYIVRERTGRAARGYKLDGVAGTAGSSSDLKLMVVLDGRHERWVFVRGDSYVRLHDAPLYFRDRATAATTARRLGLKVDDKGKVTTLAGGVPALDGVSGGAQRTRAELVKIANEAGRSSRRRGAPPLSVNSSRGVLIDWLVWNDPNGTYRDEDVRREFDADPATLDEVWEQLAITLEDY